MFKTAMIFWYRDTEISVQSAEKKLGDVYCLVQRKYIGIDMHIMYIIILQKYIYINTYSYITYDINNHNSRRLRTDENINFIFSVGPKKMLQWLKFGKITPSKKKKYTPSFGKDFLSGMREVHGLYGEVPNPQNFYQKHT